MKKYEIKALFYWFAALLLVLFISGCRSVKKSNKTEITKEFVKAHDSASEQTSKTKVKVQYKSNYIDSLFTELVSDSLIISNNKGDLIKIYKPIIKRSEIHKNIASGSFEALTDFVNKVSVWHLEKKKESEIKEKLIDKKPSLRISVIITIIIILLLVGGVIIVKKTIRST